MNQSITKINDKLEKKLENFYTDECREDIEIHKAEGKKRVTISYKKIIRYHGKLGDLLEDSPEEFFNYSKAFIRSHFDVEMEVRVRDVPDSNIMRIRDIRAKDIGKLISFEGIIEAKSDVKPHISSMKFECPACGNILNVLITQKIVKQPTKCGCGRKGKFKELRDERRQFDAFTAKIQELPSSVNYDPTLKTLSLLFEQDLTDTKLEEQIFQGIRVKVSGYLQEVDLIDNKGQVKAQQDYLFKVNYVDFREDLFFNYNITEEEMEDIQQISGSKDAIDILAKKVYPELFGYEDAKRALILQQFGGVTKQGQGVSQRGEIHVLLIGDPGTGKTDFMNIQMQHSLKANMSSGVTSTDVGLYGSVQKDEVIGGWTFVAGPVVLADNGICCIDEFNQLEKEQKSALLQPMESSKVTIRKASVQRELITRASFLVCANPKHGYFDPMESVFTQFDMPSPVINRFDWIGIIKASKDKETKKKTAQLILGRSKKIETNPLFFKKYLSYAKQINPKITDQVSEYISDLYADMGHQIDNYNESNSNKFPMSVRTVNSVKRMSEAKARLHLRHFVLKEDVDFVFDLIYVSLRSCMVDLETGKIDTELIETGVSSSQRNLRWQIIAFAKELSKENSTFQYEDLITLCKSSGIDELKAEEAIDKMKRDGDLYEPRNGFLNLIK